LRRRFWRDRNPVGDGFLLTDSRGLTVASKKSDSGSGSQADRAGPWGRHAARRAAEALAGELPARRQPHRRSGLHRQRRASRRFPLSPSQNRLPAASNDGRAMLEPDSVAGPGDRLVGTLVARG
jgi:hypothetical protein